MNNKVLALVILFSLLSGCTNTSTQTTKSEVTSPAENYSQRLTMLEPHYRIFKPQGNAPYPTVLYFHSGEGGANGYTPETQFKVNKIVDKGYAVVFVEAFASRGGVCSRCLYPSEAADDVLVSFDWANKQPWIDKNRIALFGNSFGGGTIMDALSKPAVNKSLVSLTKAKAVILKEPFCMEDQGVKGFYLVRVLNSWQDDFTIRVPVLVTQGTNDEYYSACKSIIDRNIANGSPITSNIYSGETHDLSTSAESSSWNKVFEFLDKHL